MQIERNLGTQPIAALLEEHALRHHDLVATAPAEITHKMVARACKGRRLTSNVKVKVRDAINVATGRDYTMYKQTPATRSAQGTIIANRNCRILR